MICANGEIDDGPLARAVLGQAVEPLVIAADGGVRVARYYDLPIDIVIGDLDSLEPADVDALAAAGVTIQRHPEEKNETDLELALLWAVEQGAGCLRIMGATGGRFDQALSNVYLLALPALRSVDVRIITGRQQAWLMYPGENQIAGQPGDTVSLIPLGGAVEGVRTEGLYYPLRGETLAFGPARGVSNVLQADAARVYLDAGILLAVHTMGKA